VEDRNDRRKIGIPVVQVKLYVYVLKLDRGFFFEYGSQVVAPSSQSSVRRSSGTTGSRALPARGDANVKPDPFVAMQYSHCHRISQAVVAAVGGVDK
jgi:hypothetical protein